MSVLLVLAVSWADLARRPRISDLGRRVGDLSNFDRLSREGDASRGEVDGARLVRLDDPPARERLLGLGVRPVRRDGDPVLEPDGLRLAGIDEPLSIDELAGVPDLLIQGVHEADHVPDPLRRSGLHHRVLVPEHRDDVLHLTTPFLPAPPIGALSRLGRSGCPVLDIRAERNGTWFGGLRARREGDLPRGFGARASAPNVDRAGPWGSGPARFASGGRNAPQQSKYMWNSYGCGRSRIESTSWSRLYSIQVSITSWVKTPPSSSH